MRYLFVLLLVFLSSIALATDAVVTYKLKSGRINVPRSYVVDMSPVLYLQSIIGLDKSESSFTLSISGSELADEIEGYVANILGRDQSLRISIFDVYDETSKKLLDNQHYSGAWYAKDGYESREILPSAQNSWFLLFGSKGYRGNFLVLSQYPDVKKVMPENVRDFLVAGCFGSNAQPFKDVKCSSKFIEPGGILVEVSFSYENLKLAKEIEAYVQKRLNQWMDVNE